MHDHESRKVWRYVGGGTRDHESRKVWREDVGRERVLCCCQMACPAPRLTTSSAAKAAPVGCSSCAPLLHHRRCTPPATTGRWCAPSQARCPSWMPCPSWPLASRCAAPSVMLHAVHGSMYGGSLPTCCTCRGQRAPPPGSHPQLPSTRRCPPRNCLPLQCHTNLAAVFYELEDEPDLFGSASNLGGLLTRAGAASPVAGANGSNGGSLAQQAAGQAQREERVVLLRNPPRRFVRPVQRTQKLLGMVQVLCTSSEEGCAVWWWEL